jgi:hypothetical protein
MTWRKSSHSAADGNCVEVRSDLRALRDSKSPIAVLPVSRGALRGLLTHVR